MGFKGIFVGLFWLSLDCITSCSGSWPGVEVVRFDAVWGFAFACSAVGFLGFDSGF